jgi:hypothetical protein
MRRGCRDPAPAPARHQLAASCSRTEQDVRYGSVEAASVCSIGSGVKIGSRLASDTFGRSDGSNRLVGITPLKPRRRAANAKQARRGPQAMEVSMEACVLRLVLVSHVIAG